LNSHSTRTHTTTLKATVSEAEINEALCDLLAKKHGYRLDSDNVRYRGWHTTKTNDAMLSHCWELEVTVDHSREAKA
jgi:hypothetical protein